MKVLFVHDTYFFTVDNNQYYSEHIDNSILDRYLHLGDHVTFLGRESILDNTKDSVKKFSPLDKSKCSVITVPNFKTIRGYIKYNKKVEKLVRKAVLSHDIIMARTPSALGSLAVNYARKSNKPLIGEVVGCTYDVYRHYSLRGKMVAPYFYFKQKNTIKKLPYAIYVTSEFLQKRYPTKGKKINCSNVVIDDIDISILNKRLKKISEMNDSDNLIIGTIGAINVSFKGQVIVLKSMTKSVRKNLIYEVVGNGSPSYLIKWAKKIGVLNSFKIIGALKHSEIFNFLDSIDLYIQPSLTEGLPRALIEAMSRGLPAIGSKVGGIPELLSDENLFERGNIKQLTNIIDNFDLKKMAKEATTNFHKSKDYQIENIDLKRYNFYLEFLKEHKLSIPKKLLKTIKRLENK